MGLSNELISQFAKITNDQKESRVDEATLYGEVLQYEDMLCVKFDGSSEITPVTTVIEKDDEGNITNYKYGAASVKTGDRVSVSLKNHSATITGNLTDPPPSRAEVKIGEDSILARVDDVSVLINSLGVTVNGLTTFTNGLSNGTTTIDGGCIKTGKIDAQYLNLTGAISFGDLSNSVQNSIDSANSNASAAINIASSAQSTANEAKSIAASNTVPDYIKSTYIDATTIQSPTIEGNDIRVYGTFQTMGANGWVTGYMGSAKGSVANNDGSTTETYGVALAYSWDSSSYAVSDKYIIVTDSGVRMQAGSASISVSSKHVFINTPDGNVYVNGEIKY